MIDPLFAITADNVDSSSGRDTRIDTFVEAIEPRAAERKSEHVSRHKLILRKGLEWTFGAAAVLMLIAFLLSLYEVATHVGLMSKLN